jgi:hypothetical protein
VAKASGSTMRATAEAPLTGIRQLLRSSIGERLLMLPSRENRSVAVRSRAVRIYPEAARIVEALTAGAEPANQLSLTAVVAKVLLEEHRGAVR